MVLQSSYRDEQSLHHITMVQIFWSQPTMVLQMQQKKGKKNWTVGLSCEWLHSGKKNGSPYFSSIVGQCKPFQEQ